MYKTRKLHIRISKEQAHMLRCYEDMYYKEIEKICDEMAKHKKIIPIRYLIFSECIHPANTWYLYNIAKQQYLHHRDKKGMLSSRWHPSTFLLDHNQLVINLSKQELNPFVINMNPEDTLKHTEIKHIVRLDIIYDAPFWFANFLIHYKEEHDIIRP